MRFWLLSFMGFFLFCACEQKKKETFTQETKENNKSSEFVDSFINKAQEIDLLADKELTPVKSLRWEKNDETSSSFVEVETFINEDGYPLKVVEYFSDGNYGKEGQKVYYLEENKVFAADYIYDEWIDSSNSILIEKQIFLEDEKPTYSRSRSADYIEDLVEAKWSEIRPEPIYPERAYDILGGEEPFKTHFISTIEGQGSLFLLLGEPKKEDRYVTTVMVGEVTPFLEDLLNNKEKYKYRPIKISFDIVGGNGEPEFRVLRTAEWED